jgi:hypothetical protein
MGANITTFIDTLLAAALLDIPSAFTIVLAGMLSISIVSILVLLTMSHFYQAFTLKSANWITSSNRNLVIFGLIILSIPIILLLV